MRECDIMCAIVCMCMISTYRCNRNGTQSQLILGTWRLALASFCFWLRIRCESFNVIYNKINVLHFFISVLSSSLFSSSFCLFFLLLAKREMHTFISTMLLSMYHKHQAEQSKRRKKKSTEKQNCVYRVKSSWKWLLVPCSLALSPLLYHICVRSHSQLDPQTVHL